MDFQVVGISPVFALASIFLYLWIFKVSVGGLYWTFFNGGQSCTKDLSETKMTKLGVGHFISISGYFSANYINNFHKPEVLTVILKDPTCQNLNWIKSYNINHNSFPFLLFSIL